MPFEKQFLGCYWVLVETEGLLMGHQKNMQWELPITGWIVSETPILSQMGPGVVHSKMQMVHLGLI